MSHLPRVPLHFQNNEVSKAAKENPSWESFQPHETHTSQYSEMEDRPSTHSMSRIRRYPDGKLDMMWAANLVIDAVKKAEIDGPLTDLEESLLTVIFPLKFRKKEPQQAEINTQLSRSEKEYLKDYITAHFAEELNWNAGRGGGSVPGRTRTLR